MLNKLLKQIISGHIEMENIKLRLRMLTDKETAGKLVVQLKKECRSTGNSPEYVSQRYERQLFQEISPLVRPKD